MHPVLLQIGDFFIGTYGLFIALGLMGAILVGSLRARRRGLPPEMMFDLAFVALVAGFVSARILYIALNWQEFTAAPGALIFSRTGFVFLGGLVGAVAACIVWVRRKGLPIAQVGDIAAPSLAIGHAFGRIGCHFAGCCWGGVCAVPGLGISVPRQELPGGGVFFNALEAQIDAGLVDPFAVASLPVWPVQLMEAAGLFLLAGALLWYARRGRRPGRVMALYLFGYAVLRFGLEFLRGDEARGFVFGGLMSTSQAISLLLVPVGIALWVWSRRQPVDSDPAPPSEEPKKARRTRPAKP